MVIGFEGCCGAGDAIRGDFEAVETLWGGGFEGLQVGIGGAGVALRRGGEDAVGGGGEYRVASVARLLVCVGDVERLGALGSVAVDGDGFEAETPGFDVGLGDVVDGGIVGQVDGLRDGAGEEGLGGGHHLDVAGGSGWSGCPWWA